MKLSKNRRNYRFRFPPQMRRIQKKIVFVFLTFFDENTGHRVTKFYPVYRISITYNFYFILFPLISKKYF